MIESALIGLAAVLHALALVGLALVWQRSDAHRVAAQRRDLGRDVALLREEYEHLRGDTTLWSGRMGEMVEQASGYMDRADRHRKRAEQSERRIGDGPNGAAPVDPATMDRSDHKAHVRAQFGR